MLSWQEMREKFANEWVAISEWEEDEHGDVLRGNVIYHNSRRKEFYNNLKRDYPHRNLAVRYTGEVTGPFFLDA